MHQPQQELPCTRDHVTTCVWPVTRAKRGAPWRHTLARQVLHAPYFEQQPPPRTQKGPTNTPSDRPSGWLVPGLQAHNASLPRCLRQRSKAPGGVIQQPVPNSTSLTASLAKVQRERRKKNVESTFGVRKEWKVATFFNRPCSSAFHSSWARP